MKYAVGEKKSGIEIVLGYLTSDQRHEDLTVGLIGLNSQDLHFHTQVKSNPRFLTTSPFCWIPE